MSLGNILGQILQQGMSGQGRSRLDHAVGAGGIGDLLGGLLGGQQGGGAAAGGGLGDLLGAALGGGRTGASGSAGAGGLGDLLGGSLGGRQPSAASGGGLGDLLGSVLGGGRSSSSAGSSSARSGGNNAGMAILATIAMAALKNWTDSRRAQASAAGAAGFAPQELETMTAPDTEALILRAMVSAAKADGRIEEDEIQRIVGKVGADGLSEEEKQFLMRELRAPLDLRTLVAQVPNEMVAAEVYAASLLAIDLDTQEEVAYLRQLAQALRLDGETVARLHQITGATPV